MLVFYYLNIYILILNKAIEFIIKFNKRVFSKYCENPRIGSRNITMDFEFLVTIDKNVKMDFLIIFTKPLKLNFILIKFN